MVALLTNVIARVRPNTKRPGPVLTNLLRTSPARPRLPPLREGLVLLALETRGECERESQAVRSGLGWTSLLSLAEELQLRHVYCPGP